MYRFGFKIWIVGGVVWLGCSLMIKFKFIEIQSKCKCIDLVLKFGLGGGSVARLFTHDKI